MTSGFLCCSLPFFFSDSFPSELLFLPFVFQSTTVFRTYVFNVCANAVTPDACAVTRGDLGEELSGPSPAFEVFSTELAHGGTETGKYGGDPNALCVRLGDSVFDSTTGSSSSSNGSGSNKAQLSLIDASNPAKGVSKRPLTAALLS